MMARTLVVLSTAMLLAGYDVTLAKPARQEMTGRIEGRALIPQDVARRAGRIRVTSVALYRRGAPSKVAEAPVDEHGKFTFEAAPVGVVNLIPAFELNGLREITLPNGLTLPVTVREGSTTEVALLGKGRPITGKLLLPPHIRPDTVRVSLSMLAPPTRGVLDRDGRPRRNPAMEAYGLLTAHRPHEARVSEDGTFRIDGVREGTYRIIASSSDAAKPLELLFEDVAVAGHVHTVYGKLTIPLIPGGESDKPLDLGTLRFRPRPTSP
jgi:hypothetical protein